MPHIVDASPRLTVWLFKTIDRRVVAGNNPVSERYAGQDPYIDLTPLLSEGSSVRTSKSTREPAGGFSITFPDAPHQDWQSWASAPGFQSLESLYGLAEPMDIIEIRMWGGTGALSLDLNYPIVMRGFVSQVTRTQTMGSDGKPQRMVTISGQDYGKIWQMIQVHYLPGYSEGKALLTSYPLFELFGGQAVSSMKAGEYIKKMITDIVNPQIAGMIPPEMPSDIPKKIETEGRQQTINGTTYRTGSTISVRKGMVSQSAWSYQGSLYDIMREHGDVGIWNELYVEDAEDGVHCVYRQIPALALATGRLIMDEAPTPIFCPVADFDVASISVARTDANVANYYWVDGAKLDMVSDVSRRLHGLAQGDVSIYDYQNSAKKYYGVRLMRASTQQTDDNITTTTGGVFGPAQNQREADQLSWINYRRRHMMEMNKDNVVFERGTARVKGGPTRPGSTELLKAGDYALFTFGDITWRAYVYQVDHEFMPFQGYTTTLTFERGTGFAARVALEGGASSPWLAEQTN